MKFLEKIRAQMDRKIEEVLFNDQTLRLVAAIDKELRGEPILQAVAIFDCPATDGQGIRLLYNVDLLTIVQAFGADSGPIVRWFYKCDTKAIDTKIFWPEDLSASMFSLDCVPAHINQYGAALVVSRATWKTMEAMAYKMELNRALWGPKIFDLNKEEKRD